MALAASRPLSSIMLGRVWWLLFPAFVVLTGRLTFERACGDPYRLLPGLSSTPGTAWPIAVLYVSAHAWLFMAFITTAARARRVRPDVSDVVATWGSDTVKLLLMALALAIEYLPVSLWRVLGSTLGCS